MPFSAKKDKARSTLKRLAAAPQAKAILRRPAAAPRAKAILRRPAAAPKAKATILRRPRAAPEAKAIVRRPAARALNPMDLEQTRYINWMMTREGLLSRSDMCEYKMVNLSEILRSPLQLLTCVADSGVPLGVGLYVVEDAQTMSFFRPYNKNAKKHPVFQVLCKMIDNTTHGAVQGIIVAISGWGVTMSKAALQHALGAMQAMEDHVDSHGEAS